ncbi:MAG: aldo/keto reductase [Zoogloeaceae bacterium]|nr:aldo/keto reductase [Zoogloeaceae bacterium]
MISPERTLAQGVKIPQLGLGTWQTPDNVAAECVRAAILCGYRLIDTASVYENERGVGEGVRQGLDAANLARAQVFVTTKLWNSDQGYDSALLACEKSLRRLGLEYLDLYLIHWPSPRNNRYLDSWKALVRLREEGRVRAIGVSNFEPEHLARIIAETGVVPAVNQIELHPDFAQTELRATHARHGILTQSWSPLGQGGLLRHAVITGIAQKHKRSPAQILVRWHLEEDLLVIPKSIHPARIQENFAVFDFALDEEDKAAISRLDAPEHRIGPHPNTADF